MFVIGALLFSLQFPYRYLPTVPTDRILYAIENQGAHTHTGASAHTFARTHIIILRAALFCAKCRKYKKRVDKFGGM